MQPEKRRDKTPSKSHEHPFKDTAQQTTRPVIVAALWRYTGYTILVLTTDGELCRIKGNRRHYVERLEQPFDKGWLPDELTSLVKQKVTQIQPIQQQIEEQRKQYVETFQNALPHERTDIITEAELDEAFEEYTKTEEFKRDQENMDAWCEQHEKEQLEREKQGLLRLF